MKTCDCSIQFRSVLGPVGRLGRGNKDVSAEILFQPFFSAGSHCGQFWHGEGRLFDAVRPAFPLPTAASPTFQKAQIWIILEIMSWRVTCPNHASLVFRQLPEEGPVHPQESWSCSAPALWFRAHSKRCKKVSSGILINLLLYLFIYPRVCLDCKLGASAQNCVYLSVCQECVGVDGYVRSVLIVPHVHR